MSPTRESHGLESVAFGPNGTVTTISNSVYNMTAIGEKGGLPENINELELITSVQEINSPPLFDMTMNRDLLGFDIFKVVEICIDLVNT